MIPHCLTTPEVKDLLKVRSHQGLSAMATMIYLASNPDLEKIPDFYASNEDALEDMRHLAEKEAA